MTTSAGLWVPGKVVATNEALSRLRAAGYADGFRDAMLKTGAWTDRRGKVNDRYAEAARTGRLAMCAAVRRLNLGSVPKGCGVRLAFTVQGHEKMDTAAAFLAAKWMEDGLTDSGVLADDRCVESVEVRVVHEPLVAGGAPGVYVDLGVVPCGG